MRYFIIPLLAVALIGAGCQKEPDFYMVIGLRNYPLDSNNFGIENESDNPLNYNSEKSAREFADKIKDTEDFVEVVGCNPIK